MIPGGFELLHERLRQRWGDYSPSARTCLADLLDRLEAGGVRPFDRVTEVPIRGGDQRVTVVWTRGLHWLAVSWTLTGFEQAWHFYLQASEPCAGIVTATEIAELVGRLDGAPT